MFLTRAGPALFLNQRGHRLSAKGAHDVIKTTRLYTRPTAEDRSKAIDLLPVDD